MRVAALAFGVLAGLVASLILALGGLDVAGDLGSAADRQAQAIRFGLFVIGNLGIFGAALALAAPLAGAVFLLLGAVAWIGAALLMHHSTDLVLITPPALLLIAAIFAVIAHFRRPRAVEAEEPEIEIMTPERPQRTSRLADRMEADDEDGEEPEEVGMPAFAAEQRSEPSVRGTFDDDRGRAPNEDWNPRKKQPPPPRAKPAFRPVEEEYEDDEPSGFSRFAMGISGILSFGLYAALAGAAVLIFWSVRNDAAAPPAAIVAEVPAMSSTAVVPPSSSSEQDRLPSTAETLTPILTGEPLRDVATAGTAPSTSPSELVAETATPQEPGSFGAVTLPEGPVTIPTLSDDFTNTDDGEPLPPVSAAPPSLPSEESAAEEPISAAIEEPPVEPSAAPPGQPLPRSMLPAMAALRTASGTGPTVVATPQRNTTNTGL